MKALSLAQPWAQLVAIGAKQIETRSWTTRFRGWLAIHAPQSFSLDARAVCYGGTIGQALQQAGYGMEPPYHPLPLGVVVAVARLVDVMRLRDYNMPDEPELGLGNYHLGRYIWRLQDVQILPAPVFAHGRQGLWEWEAGDHPYLPD